MLLVLETLSLDKQYFNLYDSFVKKKRRGEGEEEGMGWEREERGGEGCFLFISSSSVRWDLLEEAESSLMLGDNH